RRAPTAPFYTLSLHDALPIWPGKLAARLAQELVAQNLPHPGARLGQLVQAATARLTREQLHLDHLVQEQSATIRRLIAQPLELRSEEHTSELQSRENLVCRLL